MAMKGGKMFKVSKKRFKVSSKPSKKKKKPNKKWLVEKWLTASG
jgi:hypothetical protein